MSAARPRRDPGPPPRAGRGPLVFARDGRTARRTTPGGGIPVAAVTQIFARQAAEFKLLSFTDEQAARADGNNGLYVPTQIPANSYPGQAQALQTIVQPNFLACNASVPENDVYEITKSIYENLPVLNGIHAATREIPLQTALNGLVNPVHPGAARYYQERGVTIPERIRPA